ncbi:MAG TPA: MBL fold hydrolase [Lactobacillus sp.]|nr:MBL fold hydrolase [Lactobacillus sp.]
MTTVRFLNGLTTIGGNIMEITTATSRVIMDFGMADNGSAADPEILIAEHRLPALKSLFTNPTDHRYQHEAIFISHLHLDHTAALQYLKSDIPVYLSHDSYRLYQSLAASGLAIPLGVNLHAFEYEHHIQIGDLTVTGYASDHDAFGATAFLISDGQHHFGHSGDVRLHGPHVERVQHWMNVFRSLHLDLFMLEATSFSFEPSDNIEFSVPASEDDIQQSFSQLLQTDDRLQVINPYPRNLERLLRFNQTANAYNRPVVWELPYARLLNSFYPEALIHVLASNRLNKQDLASLIPVGLPIIKHEPQRFSLQNSYANLALLTEVKPFMYLHSNGEPLGEYDPRYASLMNFITDNDGELRHLGSSGHATRQALVAIAKTVNAQTTGIWHTFQPETAEKAMQDLDTNILLPAYDATYTF